MIPAERNYDVREKECLAIKYVLGKLRHYLLATRFTVKCLSDHKSLSYLKKGKERKESKANESDSSSDPGISFYSCVPGRP